jgi:hypothetical protein
MIRPRDIRVLPLLSELLNTIGEAMSNRTLTGLISILFLALVVVLLSSNRGVSGVMEQCGDFISRFFD